jgi:hypothetical protein
MDFEVHIAFRSGWRSPLGRGDMLELWTTGSVLLGTIRAEVLVRLLANQLDAVQIQSVIATDMAAPPRRPLGRSFLPVLPEEQERRRLARKSRRRGD